MWLFKCKWPEAEGKAGQIPSLPKKRQTIHCPEGNWRGLYWWADLLPDLPGRTAVPGLHTQGASSIPTAQLASSCLASPQIPKSDWEN